MALQSSISSLSQVTIMLFNQRHQNLRNFKKIISKCKHTLVSTIVFDARNFDLHDELITIIEYAKDFHTILLVNDYPFSVDFASKLFKAGLSEIYVTIYSSSPEVHNQISQKDNFKFAINNIVSSVSAYLATHASIPLCLSNIDTACETIDYLYGFGVRFFDFSVFIKNEPEKAFDEKLLECLKKIKEHSSKYKDIYISFNSPGWINEMKLLSLGYDVPRCGACYTRITVTPNGDIYTCSSQVANHTILGNIIHDSWNKICANYSFNSIGARTYADANSCPFLFKFEVCACTEQR